MPPPLLKPLQKAMLLMWDRNVLTYGHVRLVLSRQAYRLARIRKNLIFRPTRRLRDGSYLAKLYRNVSDREHDRGGIVVRIIEYTFDDPKRPGSGEKHRLLTTWLDAQRDPAKTLVELYHVRWEEELAIDELKTHEMQRPVLRTLMFEAAKGVPTSPLRMSFVGTLKILRRRLPECPRSRPARQEWWRNLLEDIGEEVIPPRRDRINPRVIKRKMSHGLKKRPEHDHWPQPSKPFRQSIVMLR